LISVFKEAFLFENRYLLCTGEIFEEGRDQFNVSELKQETARCIKELQTFTAILQEVFITFFELRYIAIGKLK